MRILCVIANGMVNIWSDTNSSIMMLILYANLEMWIKFDNLGTD